MTPRASGLLCLTLLVIGFTATRGLPEDQAWLLRLLLLCGMPLALNSEPKGKSTMGAEGDLLVGFDARVTRLDPLQVEAQGTVWQAKCPEARELAVGASVRVVGRSGLTLLVCSPALGVSQPPRVG